ncbi:MAG: hypothetical protein K0R18_72 [Bacillales bacterium]|jgi:hypothetical protein|nr:hypothetical protein [Bacillales bacterium]
MLLKEDGKIKKEVGVIMKRLLKKKAWEKINLYHVTNSQLFTMIVDDGQIVPGTYVDRVSYGTGEAEPYRDVFKPSVHTPDQMKTYPIKRLFDDMNSEYSGVDTTKELKKQINDIVDQIKVEHPDDYEQVMNDDQLDILETITPSGSDGIYLSGRPDRSMYRSNRWENRPWAQLPAWNTEFKIECDTDALGPDLDDGYVNKNNPELPWKQTLKDSNQCIHYGPIQLDSITGVKFDELDFRYLYDMYDREILEDIEYYFKKYISTGSWQSLSIAYEQCKEFYTQINKTVNPNLNQEQSTAKIKTTRLKKRAN